ncbi:NAD-dependent epimerase/dehydratase family protein [Nonomuraea dietziae]|uniref:NAD-dependent epimerase/dehydratase family protein n=1 Tax=Nonomuraea dietziae TaxID=65515 RepID=UPI0036231ABB
MRVLVAGGSGAVGRLVVPVLATRHTVRVMDLSPPRDEPFHGSEFFHGSVTDPGAVERAAEGQDAVVYLAMGRKTGWREGPEWVASHFAANVTGTYVTLQGCAAAGVRRAVYAGSMSVFTDYTARDYTSSPEPDATDAYGLTKRLGEQVCEAAAVEHGLAVTVLRLVGPMPDEEWHAYGRAPRRGHRGKRRGRRLPRRARTRGARPRRLHDHRRPRTAGAGLVARSRRPRLAAAGPARAVTADAVSSPRPSRSAWRAAPP